MPKGNGYEVHRKFLKTVDFETLVLKIPDDDIEDKLTFLVTEKGQITKSLFEDFLFANCIANINQLMFHLNQSITNATDLLKVREELLDFILDINPLLMSSNLVINTNHVIKIKTGKKIKKGEIILDENKSWNNSSYEDILTGALADEKDAEEKVPVKKKDVESLDFNVIKKWWKRINQYVKIKVYSENDVESILKHRVFHNRISFETFIVSVCVDGFEELFTILDELGIPKRVAPPILMHELYELCKSCNEFLTFKNAQELASKENPDEYEDDDNPLVSGAVKAATGMSRYTRKTKKRLFKDVPKEDILKVGDNMKVFLMGQDTAVDAIADSIQRASVGLKDPEKPLGSFLFAGRTGVGKTFATKVLADELIKGSKDNMITIDCSEFTADHEYSKLIGAPAGYVGHEHGGMLTNAIQKNPFLVVVFDEVEKANYKVHQLLLQILEEGRLTDGKGKTTSFKDAIVIMTSNVGVKEVSAIQKTIGFGDVSKLTEEKKNIALKEALKSKFKPEFLNRIGSIVNFRNLVKKDYMRIIDSELYKLNDNLKSNDSEYKTIELKFDKKIKEYIYKNGINEEYGARPLKRCIENDVSTPLARKLLGEDVDKDSTVLVGAKRGKVVFEEKKKIYNPPFYISDNYKEIGDISNLNGNISRGYTS